MLLASISEGTLQQYSACYSKYWSYCKSKSLNFFNYTLNNFLNFLVHEIDKGSSYSTINSYRSALNLIFSINNEDERLIKRFLKGAYNIKPPQPRYSSTWNLEPVLKYLETLYPLQNLSLEKLTIKTVTLMALTTAHRVQTLSKITLNNIIKTTEKIEIKIPDKIKTSGPRKNQPVLVFPYFPAKPQLCVASTIEHYLKTTSTIRTTFSHLLLTHKRPHHPASTQTISRWIKVALKNSGINVKIFSGHSVRHAATSAAFRSGVNINVIKNTAGWSEASEVFFKFYNKPVSQPNDIFASTILNLGLGGP